MGADLVINSGQTGGPLTHYLYRCVTPCGLKFLAYSARTGLSRMGCASII